MDDHIAYPNLERRELSGHSSRAVMTISGLPALLFGIPFAAAGILVIAVFSGFWELADTSRDAPRLVVLPIGAVFASVGLGLMYFGLRTTLRKAAVARRRRDNPGQRWAWDYPWNPDGETTSELSSLVRGLVFLLLYAAFLTPFNWLCFDLEFLGVPSSGEIVPFWVILVVGLFDLLGVGIFVGMVYHLLRFLRYGNSRLRYVSFPFFLGDELNVALAKGPDLGKLTSVEVRLRCVEETFETRSSGSSRSSQVVAYAVYEDLLSFDEQHLRHARGRELPISFVLPTDPLGTGLSERPPRYWEVAIKSDAPGVDYGAIFLVPVYPRS